MKTRESGQNDGKMVAKMRVLAYPRNILDPVAVLMMEMCVIYTFGSIKINK